MNGITINKLKEQNNVHIIDIRDNYSYTMSHLDNAINIPYYSLINNYSMYLNKNEVYCFYCDFSHQSQSLSNMLNAIGYKTYYLIEGYLEYKVNNYNK